MSEILKVIEQSLEKNRAQKKFIGSGGSSNGVDWSAQLIISSFKNRFSRSRYASEDFRDFI